MSGKISGIVWEADLPQNEKFVLLAYADHADHDGNGVFPSVGLIAWKTGYSKRNIPRIKNKLIERKILHQTGTTSAGVPIYRIVIAKIPKLSPRTQNNEDGLSGGDNLSGGDDTIVSGGDDTAMSPKPSVKPPIKTSVKEGGAKNAPAPRKSKIEREPKPAAVIAYNQIASLYPDKALWIDLDNAIGDKPDDLKRWQATVKAYIGCGWNKRNVSGMMDFYRRGEMPGYKAQNGATGATAKQEANRAANEALRYVLDPFKNQWFDSKTRTYMTEAEYAAVMS